MLQSNNDTNRAKVEQAVSQAQDFPLSGKKVTLDPGHGWGESGASANGMLEKDLTLDIANRIKPLLEAYGIQVTMTRTGDEPGGDAVARANEYNADIVVSIHVNAGGGTGTESCNVVNKSTSSESWRLGEFLTNEIASQLNLYKRGDFAENDGGRCARSNSTGWTQLYIHDMNPVASLVEVAFIDGPQNNDVDKLKNQRQDFAQAIADSVVKYFGGTPVPPDPCAVSATLQMQTADWEKNGATCSDVTMQNFNPGDGTRLYQAIRGTSAGVLNGVYTRYTKDGNTWTSWVQDGATLSNVEMMIFNPGDGVRLYQAIRGTLAGVLNGVYTRYTKDGNTWTSWVQDGATNSDVNMAVFNPGDGNRLYQAVRGTDNGVWTRYIPSNSGTTPSAPTNIQASDGGYTDRIRITWSSSAGATSYEVWRNTANNSGSAIQIAASVNSTSYDDMTAIAGTTYYYWLKAKNSYGISGFSASILGYRGEGYQVYLPVMIK